MKGQGLKLKLRRQPALKVRSLQPEKYEKDDQVVKQVQLAMSHMAAGAAQLIGENVRALKNIYGENQLTMPSTKPLIAMAGMTGLFIQLAELGSDSIKVIEEITAELNKLADPKLDRFVASELIEKILKLIGGRLPKFVRQLSYGLASSKTEKDGFHKVVEGKAAAKNAASITKFSAVLPDNFRLACLNTAKSSGRIRKLALDQHERAGKIQADFNTAFADDLLPSYANEVARNADAIPVLTAQQSQLRAQLGASANKARPDPNLAESQMRAVTNALVNAIEAMARAREMWTKRALTLNASAQGTISARVIAENTGGLALRHVDQLGLMLITHFFRMLTISLLALAVALGFAEFPVIVTYWKISAEEDQLVAKAMTLGVAELQATSPTQHPQPKTRGALAAQPRRQQ